MYHPRGKNRQNSPGRKNTRFTLMLEAFAIRVFKATRRVKEARKLHGLNWYQVNTIKARTVARRLARCKDEPIRYVGLNNEQPLGATTVYQNTRRPTARPGFMDWI